MMPQFAGRMLGVRSSDADTALMALMLALHTKYTN